DPGCIPITHSNSIPHGSMKIAIIGQTERADVWEKHLRSFRSVQEVVSTSRLDFVGQADACLLIDDSEDKLGQVLKAVKLGYPTFLVSRLSCDIDRLRQIHAASQEAGAPVQFSHWPTFASSMHWMRQQVPKPTWYSATKHLLAAAYTENADQLSAHWIDEVALVCKWFDSSVQRMSAHAHMVKGFPTGIHIQLHFENGSTAVIAVSLVHSNPSHVRIASDPQMQLEIDVTSQQIRSITFEQGAHLSIQKYSFDASDTAELSLGRFLKAVQQRKPVSFSTYDALRTATIVDQIEKQIARQGP
ncbi:MAG: hypothetical protein ACO37D_11340, partial [Rhodothermales bacterium]